MNKFHLVVLACLLAPAISPAQRSIVVIGSSTAAGDGATTYDSSWVGRLSRHYIDLGLIDTIYNRATGGRTTLDCLPTDPLHLGEGQYPYPDTGRNVTRAISYRPLPLLVIISLPSNDVTSGIPMATYLGNLRLMYNFVTAAGIPCIITNTQPRDDIDNPSRDYQLAAGDSILTEFPHNSFDFWDTLVDLSTLDIKPAFRFVDGIHVNNAGHLALYTKALQYGNILSAPLIPLPLTLISFKAQLEKQTALLTWTTADETGPIEFHIQRSADGAQYDEIASEKAEGNTSPTNYSWTDDHILSGKSFYRLHITDNGIDKYSPIAPLVNTTKGWSIHTVYHPGGGSSLIADIDASTDQTLHMMILNASGAVIRRQTVNLKAPGKQVPVNVEGLSQGEYFLKIMTDKGQSETVAFIQF